MIIKNKLKTFAYYFGHLMSDKNKSKIIFYHDIHSDCKYTYMSTPLALFQRHIAVVGNENFEIVRDIRNEYGQLAIMFDDGFRGLYDNKDFFLDNRIKPTIFVAKSLVGKDNYMTEKELFELDKLGFNIQSHTVSHKKLTNFDSEQVRQELLESKDYLEQVLGHSIDSICAPQGYFSRAVYNMAMECGYAYFYSSVPGDFSDLIFDDMKSLKTRTLVQSLSESQFRYTILGGQNILKKHFLNRHYEQC